MKKIIVLILSLLPSACGHTEQVVDVRDDSNLTNSSKSLKQSSKTRSSADQSVGLGQKSSDDSYAAKALMLGGVHYQQLSFNCQINGEGAELASLSCKLINQVDKSAVALDPAYDTRIAAFDGNGRLLDVTGQRSDDEVGSHWLIVGADHIGAVESVALSVSYDFSLKYKWEKK